MTVAGHSASRRVVTVVFADVVGSTALAERLDPEVTRGVLTRFYEAARQIMGGHGGTVEKFIGDAVMAVFGIPELHEDDALRAAGAALALRVSMGAESDRLAARYDVRLDLRIGIATGEVAVGDPAHGTTLVTGDAVNVAARLQGAAQPGDILIAPATRRLLRDSARVEALEPLVLKGKAEPVAACRLLALEAAPRDVGHRPMVGRSGDADMIRDALQRAIDERRPGLVTVMGGPGIGKSRLLAAVLPEFAASATIIEGHCLAYGDGITYWPIAEIVRSVAGIDDRDAPEVARGKLDAVLAEATDGPAAAAQLASAIGLGTDGGAGDQTPWAVRRLLEVVAEWRPLLVVIEDLQWADPVLLDLLEYVLGWAAAVPAVVIALARPELRERRPDWGTAIDGAVSLTLRPLGPDVIAELVVDRTDASVPPAVIEHVVRASDGNPLFADELLTMLLEDGHARRGDDGWIIGDLERVPVPPTIGALLAARLDRLPAAGAPCARARGATPARPRAHRAAPARGWPGHRSAHPRRSTPGACRALRPGGGRDARRGGRRWSAGPGHARGRR